MNNKLESVWKRTNVVFEWLTFLLHIWEVSDSNLVPDTGYID
jgi:hypothetical protein